MRKQIIGAVLFAVVLALAAVAQQGGFNQNGAVYTAASPITITSNQIGCPSCGSVTSVSGTANQIASSGGATPVISFVTSPVMPSGTTATTQSAGDNSTKLATTQYVATAVGTPVTTVSGTSPIVSSGGATPAISCPTCSPTGPNSTVTGNIIGGVGTATSGDIVPMYDSFATAFSNTPFAVASQPGWIRNYSTYIAGAETAGALQHQGIYTGASTGTQSSYRSHLTLLGGQGSATYRDTATSLRVWQGDFPVAAFDTASTVNALAPTAWSAEFILDDGGDTTGESASSLTDALSTTTYDGPYVDAFNTTSALVAGVAPFAGTLQNFCVSTGSTQSSTGTLVFTLYVNGSSTSVAVTIGTSATAGVYCDLADTASIASGQTYYWQIVNNATATSAQIYGVGLELLPTSGTPGLIGGAIALTLTASTTDYWLPFAENVSATESGKRMPMPRAGSVSNLCVNVSTAQNNVTSVTLMKNGSTTALTFNLANATGPQCSTTGGPIAYSQGDTMDLQIISPSGSQFALGGWSINF